MKSCPVCGFVFKAVVAGLALAFVVSWVWGLLPARRQQVEVTHAAMPSSAPAPAAVPAAGRAPSSYAPAVRRAAPAVVHVYSAQSPSPPQPRARDPLFKRFFGGDTGPLRPQEAQALGSGVLVSRDGVILTNHHVVAGADRIVVELADGRQAYATLAGADPETDIAVLRVKLPKLPAIAFGDSDTLQIGDVVLAIGNPYGVGQSVTLGIVSATGRSELGISTFEDFIQTDAAINPGNSGGALVTADGHLVGINTAIFQRGAEVLTEAQGIGFAIPARLAQVVMEEILEKGYVARGWIGVEAEDMPPELAQALRLGDNPGILVRGVHDGSPAQAAGLRSGDILRRINGQPVPSARGALGLITALMPAQEATLELLRAGEPLMVTATVRQRPVNGG
jgi:Do/DeqQ family serine protease